MRRTTLAAALCGAFLTTLSAQTYPPPPTYGPQQLEQLVGRIALYPDPLLAQVLTAATYWDQLPDANGWARAHAYLTGDQLARDIEDDYLPWDPSVQALLPFPSVLNILAGDMNWTGQLGNAVLADRARVMDAIQDARQRAYSYGYLRSTPQQRIVMAVPGEIQILPIEPNAIFVPYYDPYQVFYRPPPGIMVGGAITFGPRIFIGSFMPWGWLNISFGWRNHSIIINNRPWERTWARRDYAHPYQLPVRPPIAPGPRRERHELRPYSEPPRGGPGPGPRAAPPARGGGPGGGGPGGSGDRGTPPPNRGGGPKSGGDGRGGRGR